MQTFLHNGSYSDEAERLCISERLFAAREKLGRVSSP